MGYKRVVVIHKVWLNVSTFNPTRASVYMERNSLASYQFPNDPGALLVKVQGMFRPMQNLTVGNATINTDGIPAFKWYLDGYFLNNDKDLLRSQRISVTPGLSMLPNTVFDTGFEPFFVSSDCPTFEVGCDYVQGALIENIMVTFQDVVTIGTDFPGNRYYLGRLYLSYLFQTT